MNKSMPKNPHLYGLSTGARYLSENIRDVYVDLPVHFTLFKKKKPCSICMWLCQTDPQQSKAAEGGL